jgi:hypothetical protein
MIFLNKHYSELSYIRDKMVEVAGFVSTPLSTDPAPFASNFAWTSNSGGTTNLLQNNPDFIGPGVPPVSNQVTGNKKSSLFLYLSN